MKQTGKESTVTTQEQRSSEAESFIKAFWGVRYQVKDVSRSIAFYTQQLGFKLDRQALPAFRNVSITLRHTGEKFRLQEAARRPLPAAAAGG